MFGYLTLVTALIISLSSAVYSILGLTAIFAAAFWPIVIMGGSLEIGKIVTTLWLHKYWNKAELQYKVYLCSAVAILMLLTSMGVFGFLSKAHLDQAVPSGDVAAKVQIFDDKIKTQQDNIKAARAALTQMDSAVDQTMSRSTTEQGADKAANLRRSQGRERTALQNDISKAQKEITTLQEQRAPIASEMRKVEAEVGPIKYIAALIYGDNPEANVLEKAVRWVIILIVIVFDPLALTLLLAATKTFEWEHEIDLFNLGKKKEEDKTPFDDWTNEDFDELNKSLAEASDDPPEPVVEEVDLEKKLRWSGFGFPMGSIFNKKEELVNEPVEQLAINDGIDAHSDDYISKEESAPVAEKPKTAIDNHPLGDLLKTFYEIGNPKENLNDHHDALENGDINVLPWHQADHINQLPLSDREKKELIDLSKQQEETRKFSIGLEADNVPTAPMGEVRGFGINFPTDVNKGDMFLRVDQLPTALYKYNGMNWIAVPKNNSDQYAYNESYIDHLISKIDSGEYDPDLLSDAERDSIEKRLTNKRLG